MSQLRAHGVARRGPVVVVVWLTCGLGVLVGMPAIAAASPWGVGLVSSRGEAGARAAPGAPQNAAAVCASPISTQINVTWTAVPLATTYLIYESTTSASAGFSLAASGVTTTSWSASGLALANYWFEVAALIGTHWQGPTSTSTGETTIALVACTQP